MFHCKCFECCTDDNVSSNDVYPAALKLVIRYHIRNLCSAQHCVDSLVIYLNSPSTSDGTMLLWDVDHNGLVRVLLSPCFVLGAFLRLSVFSIRCTTDMQSPTWKRTHSDI